MKKYRLIIAFVGFLVVLGVGAFFLISPQHVRFEPGGMIEDPDSATGFACPKHGIALVSEPGYFARGSVMQGTADYNEVFGDYPGSIPLNGSLVESQIHRVPALLTFCKRCEAEIHHHFAEATRAEQGESLKP